MAGLACPMSVWTSVTGALLMIRAETNECRSECILTRRSPAQRGPESVAKSIRAAYGPSVGCGEYQIVGRWRALKLPSVENWDEVRRELYSARPGFDLWRVVGWADIFA